MTAKYNVIPFLAEKIKPFFELVFKDIWSVFAFFNLFYIAFLFSDYYFPIDNKAELVFKQYIIKDNKVSGWKRSFSGKYKSYSVLVNKEDKIYLITSLKQPNLLSVDQKIYIYKTSFLNRNSRIEFQYNGIFFIENISFLQLKLIKILYFLSFLFSILYICFSGNNLIHIMFSIFSSICFFITIIYFYRY